MGLFDSLLQLPSRQSAQPNAPQSLPSGLDALSPQMQAINQIISQRRQEAFFNGLLQAGQPSPYKIGFGQALGMGANAASQAAAPLQDELLKSRIGALAPKYEVTKDAFGNPIAYNSLNPSDTKPLGGTGMFGGGGNMPASGGAVGDASNPAGVSGDEFLKTLPPQIGTQVKAIAEGRMAMPGGMAMKTPYWQQMLQAVGQYDPNFDGVNYNARNKTYQDFTTGKSKQNLNSIDTALNTLTQLQDANEKVGGAQFGNSIRNFFLDQSSDPNLVRYNALAKTAADEVTKAVVGGTGGTGEDRKKRFDVFSPNQSPEARKAAIQASIEELNARLDPLAQSYNQGMGTNKGGVDLLTPKTVAGYQKIMGNTPENINANGKKTLQNSQIQPGTKEYNNAIMKAKSAIASGKDPAAVRARLQQYGINPQGF